MLTARDIMTPSPTTIGPKDSVGEAARIMLEKKFNGLPVVNSQGKLLGVICQSDLVAQQKKLDLPSLFTMLDGFLTIFGGNMEKDSKKITALTVEDAMTKNPATVAPDTSLEELATTMFKRKYYTLPVVQNGALVGVIGKEDILRTLLPNKH